MKRLSILVFTLSLILGVDSIMAKVEPSQYAYFIDNEKTKGFVIDISRSDTNKTCKQTELEVIYRVIESNSYTRSDPKTRLSTELLRRKISFSSKVESVNIKDNNFITFVNYVSAKRTRNMLFAFVYDLNYDTFTLASSVLYRKRGTNNDVYFLEIEQGTKVRELMNKSIIEKDGYHELKRESKVYCVDYLGTRSL